MKLLTRITLLPLFCFSTAPTLAANNYYPDSQYFQQTTINTDNIAKYLRNLGSYLGYDVTKPPSAGISQQLLNLPAAQLAETYIFSTVFGAMPVPALVRQLTGPFQFVSSNIPGASTINGLANATFRYQNYNQSGNGQNTIHVSEGIDQPAYQYDPVSQFVLNMLATPDQSYCVDADGNPINQCPYLFGNQVMSNVVGPLPNPQDFFSYAYNESLLGQLNANVLLAPLFYSTDNTTQNTSSNQANSPANGLNAQNTAQQAANFIRYASGSVLPPNLPSKADYTNLFLKAAPPRGTNVSFTDQTKAKATLNNYFNSLRVYAAQASVGIGNLYYILSKRLPQSLTGDGKNLTSQAMSEFNMATWRLFNSDPNSGGRQWIEQINGASSTTVQKEIAVLLAEINYQMYLDRQLQERMLLTNTIMLMQNSRNVQPTADFSAQNAGAATQ